jgi:hypothetical protein
MHPRTSPRRVLVALAALAVVPFSAGPAFADTAGVPLDPPTAGSVCLTAKSDVESSARYLALPSSKRASIDRYAADLCANADAIVAGLTPAQKESLRAQFNDAVARAVPQRWLTAAQAAELQAAAATL